MQIPTTTTKKRLFYFELDNKHACAGVLPSFLPSLTDALTTLTLTLTLTLAIHRCCSRAPRGRNGFCLR